MPRQKSTKIDKVIDEVEPTPVAAEQTELDPEVLEAINARKPKKPKTNGDVDYIPELERDESLDSEL